MLANHLRPTLYPPENRADIKIRNQTEEQRLFLLILAGLPPTPVR